MISGPTNLPAPHAIDVHCGWGATAAAPQWNDVATVRASLAERGIAHAFLTSTLARRYDPVAGNDALATALAANRQDSSILLHGWVVIQAAQAAESHAMMRRHLYNESFVGAALYPDPVSGDPVTLRDNSEIINSFRRYGKPLMIEALTSEAMAYAVEIADSLGGAKVIVSGMGGDEWHEAITIAARPLNLYLDIAGALTPEKISFAIATFHGTRKLLFASGAPQTDPAAMLGMLDDIPITADDKERIVYTNATRLFHLAAGPAVSMTLAPMSHPDQAPEDAG